MKPVIRVFSRNIEKSIVGQDGCSKFLNLGMADVEEPDSVATELKSLRADMTLLEPSPLESSL